MYTDRSVGLLKWLTDLRDDPDILRGMQEGDPDPVQYLEENVLHLVKQLENASAELDEVVNRSSACACLFRVLTD